MFKGLQGCMEILSIKINGHIDKLKDIDRTINPLKIVVGQKTTQSYSTEYDVAIQRTRKLFMQ